eukprot:scaffold1594_cov171-Ochromonas_danica.AAC.6
MHQSDTCDAEILETTAFVNGYCFRSGGASFMYKWPYFYYYSNSGKCQGYGYPTDQSLGGCTPNGNNDDDYVDYGAYHSSSNVVVDGDDDKSDDSLSGWKIAVIVLCLVAGFVLIAGLAYYFFVVKKSVPMSSVVKVDDPDLL